MVLHWSVWYQATKLRAFFQEATTEPDENAEKPTACHLMPHNKHPGEQGCNYQFRNHKGI
jgi:hypothetical protein